MCGRYASARKRIELLEEFRIERDRVSEPLEPDYNVAPTKRVYAVVTREARRSDGAGTEARGAAEAASEPDAGQAGVACLMRTAGVMNELRRWPAFRVRLAASGRPRP